MAKIKVYELAKELSLDSKDIIRRLQKIGFEVKSHMSTLEDRQVEIIRQFASQKNDNEENASKVIEAPKSFVPKVTRIPKAVLVQEKSVEVEANVADNPEKSADQEPVAKQQDIPQPSAKKEITTPPPKEVPSVSKEQPQDPVAPVKSQAAVNQEKEPLVQQENQLKQAKEAEEKSMPQKEQAATQDDAPKTEETAAPPKTPTAQKQISVDQSGANRSDRPAGQGQRPAAQAQQNRGDRPSGQGQRPPGQGQRPAAQTQQNRGDRPAGQGQRPPGQSQPYRGDRPAGQAQRPSGQGQPYRGDRPAGQWRPSCRASTSILFRSDTQGQRP